MARFSTPDGKIYEADSASVRQLLDVWHLKKAIGGKVGGKMVDRPHLVQAQNVLARARR